MNRPFNTQINYDKLYKFVVLRKLQLEIDEIFP